MSVPDNEPWKMTAKLWYGRMNQIKGTEVQARFTRSSSSESINRMESLTAMRFDVHGAATKRLELAKKGEIKLSKEEVDDLLDQLATQVTHQMVVEKAMREGYPVPEEVLADYPDILTPTPQAVTA